jgi:succinate dehydrogenase flavin-adding protein (antitoxin of CptAB toxin-antitoxin module)
MAEKSGAVSRLQAAFHEAIGRMETVVDQETSLLRENRAVELTGFNHRKQQGLLEIDRILRNFSPVDMQRVDRECMRKLVRKLESNRQILAHHLKATEEISGLMSRAMQEAESDGTYGRGGS